MKRCVQCDFLYEDDQGLCDMDGRELIYEPTLQALQVKVPTQLTAPPVKSHGKQFAFAAATTVFMVVAISVGYSGFSRDYAPQDTKGSSKNVIRAPQSVPALVPATPVVSPTPSPRQSPESARPQKITVSATRAAPIAKPSPERFRSPTLRQEVRRPQPAMANHKKQSQIGGFLKKTARILKKPFKRF